MVHRIRVVALCLLSLLAICILAFWLFSTLSAAPPKIDFYNVPAYRQALAQSKNADAKAIHAEIVNGPADLAQAKAAATKAGIPLTPAPMPPDSENAYFIYKKWDAAHAGGKGYFSDPANPLRMNIVNTPRQLAADQKVIDDHPEIFALLDQATDAPHYAAPVGDFREAALREAAREIVTHAYLLAHQGHFADAVKMQERGFAIARQVGDSPSGVNYLLSAVLENVTLSGMQNLLYLVGPNASDAEQVKQAVAAFHPVSRADALRGSVSGALALFDSQRNDSASDMLHLFQPNVVDNNASTPSPAAYSPEDRQFVSEYIDAVEARYLNDTLSELTQINGHPETSPPPSLSEPQEFMGTDSRNPITAATSGIEPWTWPPSLTAAPDHTAASRQVTLAAATILATKVKNGAFPAALSCEFTDPFNHNKPLGYRVDANGQGFVVYSIGETGAFDGGAPDKWYWRENVFRYPAPPSTPWPY